MGFSAAALWPIEHPLFTQPAHPFSRPSILFFWFPLLPFTLPPQPPCLLSPSPLLPFFVTPSFCNLCHCPVLTSMMPLCILSFQFISIIFAFLQAFLCVLTALLFLQAAVSFFELCSLSLPVSLGIFYLYSLFMYSVFCILSSPSPLLFCTSCLFSTPFACLHPHQ